MAKACLVRVSSGQCESVACRVDGYPRLWWFPTLKKFIPDKEVVLVDELTSNVRDSALPPDVIGVRHTVLKQDGTLTIEYEKEAVEDFEEPAVVEVPCKRSDSLWKYPNVAPPRESKWYLIRLSKLLCGDGVSPYRVAMYDAGVKAWHDSTSRHSYTKFDVVQYMDPLLIR